MDADADHTVSGAVEGDAMNSQRRTPDADQRTRSNTLRSRSNTFNAESVPMSLENNATLPVERLQDVNERMDTPETAADKDGAFSLRMTPFIDHSSHHPHMFFGPIIRKAQPGTAIEVGRYTERTRAAAAAPQGSSEMVVFKSKVVSRRHAELTVDSEGQWWIQDVGSSSGTFVNHVRLSPPNEPSALQRLGDSDVIQLGVDYRGGAEDVFRCVRVRVELNESWRKVANEFTRQAHAKLKNLVQEDDRCSICLESIGQCQALFVSPCSHWWHYPCIRPLLVKNYPHFSCPNCKALCHLEADLEESLG